jgi:hypothetical protein
MTLIELITQIFKENLQKFPSHMGKDNASLAADIKKWNSEFTLKGIDAQKLSEVHEQIEKDSRFVAKPAELDDYLAIKNLLDLIDELGTDDNSRNLIVEMRKINNLFGHRYGFKWKMKALQDDIERLKIWISDLKLYNIDASSVEKAGTWIGTKSDYNRYAPTVQDFVLACRMAMIGQDVPSPKEAYLIITGLTKRKSHPLVDWTVTQVKVYEQKHNKAIPQEVYLTIYQDALYEYGATGEIPKPKTQIDSEQVEDKSDIIGKDDLLAIIQKIKENA